MTFAIGLVLMAATVVMMTLARPNKHGEPVAFLNVWAAAQAYILSALLSAILGMSLVLSEWPS